MKRIMHYCKWLACGEASLGVSLESCGCSFRRCYALCPWRMPHITFLTGSPTPFHHFLTLHPFYPTSSFIYIVGSNILTNFKNKNIT